MAACEESVLCCEVVCCLWIECVLHCLWRECVLRCCVGESMDSPCVQTLPLHGEISAKVFDQKPFKIFWETLSFLILINNLWELIYKNRQAGGLDKLIVYVDHCKFNTIINEYLWDSPGVICLINCINFISIFFPVYAVESFLFLLSRHRMSHALVHVVPWDHAHRSFNHMARPIPQFLIQHGGPL